MKRVAIVGAGRVGQTLGRLAVDSTQYTICGLVGRQPPAQMLASEACEFIGQGTWVALAEVVDLQPDLILLTVPDGAIAQVGEALSAYDLHGIEVMHCSGALSVDALAACAAVGAHVSAIHPVCSFSTPAIGVATFAGTPCIVEGTNAPLAEALFQTIGGELVQMPTGVDKVLYHAAIVFACNYLYTLHGTANELLARIGFGDGELVKILGPIMQQTLANSVKLGPKQALTGPVVRADEKTIAAHLRALPEPLQSLYRELALATVSLADDRIDEDGLLRLRKLLSP